MNHKFADSGIARDSTGSETALDASDGSLGLRHQSQNVRQYGRDKDEIGCDTM
jgi:hypothetical protein